MSAPACAVLLLPAGALPFSRTPCGPVTRRSRPAAPVRAAALVGSTLVIVALTAVIAGPYVRRVYREFGHPFGSDYLRNSITLQRHDLPALVGLMLAAVLDSAGRPARRRGRALLAGVLAAALVVGGVAGALSALYGWPRRLVGAQSVFVLDDRRAVSWSAPTWRTGTPRWPG